MIELKAKCVCDGCGVEAEPIGIPPRLSTWFLEDAQSVARTIFFSIPTFWAWFENSLYCIQCMDGIRAMLGANREKQRIKEEATNARG